MINEFQPMNHLTSLQNLICTIGNLPTSYVLSMSYEEQLWWLCNFLETKVFPAIETNTEITEEIQRAFLELQQYITDYFNNLDVQEEINNKLDYMYENGTLKTIISTYVDGYTEQITYIVNNQNNIINSLANGTPIPVNSVDNMTDTSKIYVNISNGYWYYYNGTNWVQGGLYQSAQSTDDVNGLIYNQINENLKYQLGLIKGNISNGNVVTNTQKFLVTSEILKFAYDLYIPFNEFLNTSVYYYQEDNTYIKELLNVSNPTRGFRIPAGQKFRLRIRKYDTSDEPNIDNIYTSFIFTSFNILPFSIYKKQQFDILSKNGYLIDVENLKNNIKIDIGDLSNLGLDYVNASSNRRLFTQLLHYDFDVIIPKNDNVDVYLYKFSNINYDNVQAIGWINISNSDYIISANTYFRLLIAPRPHDTNIPIYDIYNNDIFKNFKLYKRKTEIVNNNIEYIKTFKSVAHQGYSTTSEFYGNCRLSSYIGAKEHGFDYGECDIKFTSDNVPVCSHDSTFTDSVTGESVTIQNKTFQELEEYNYHGEKIAKLEDVLKLCKELGLGLYLDHLSAWDDTKWNIIFNIVKKYQMQDNVVWLSASDTIINKILTFYKYSSISLVTSDSDLTNIINLANQVKTDFNNISIDFNYVNVTVENLIEYLQNLSPNIKMEIWTVDNNDVYKNYIPYVSAITSNKICYNDIKGLL